MLGSNYLYDNGMLKLLPFVLSLFLLMPVGAEQELSLIAQADAA